jgi:transketolase
MTRTLFKPPELPPETETELERLCLEARGDILHMTTLAGSGHPGGSMSSLEILALLWSQASVNPKNPCARGRDRIVVSHGHVSPGVYSVLGRLGFICLEDALVGFRQAGSSFEGHVERHVPGIELTSGNLGQGLSAGAGMAIADRSLGYGNHVWVVTGDGEQQKGQISEARRFAGKYGLANLTCIVDCNGLQISGRTADIMPVNHRAEFLASGWEVACVDGHDLGALYRALRPSGQKAPRLVIAETVMGKGVSFMENDPEYHGRAPRVDELERALAELGLENRIEQLKDQRESGIPRLSFPCEPRYHVLAHQGRPATYPPDHRGDNRSAWGAALLDLARANSDDPPLVFDCDLAGSVKTSAFAREFPEYHFQCGIMEHNTASAAGGASLSDRVVFWADFGVFAADEAFNQHRLNDINHTNLKVVATHCGLDVGPDGKTHHCVKYVGLMRALYNFFTVVPADPNQTDRVVRFAAMHPGNFFIAMGRSAQQVIAREDGKPFFGDDYKFVFGRPDTLRDGTDAALLAMGPMCQRALKVREILAGRGISLRVYAVSAPNALAESFVRTLMPFRLLATYEDHDADTGMGAGLALRLSSMDGAPPMVRFGVREYGMSGEPDDLYRAQGLQPDQVAEALAARLG